MSLWKRVFKSRESTQVVTPRTAPRGSAPATKILSEAAKSAGYSPIELPDSHDEIVDSIVQSLLARESCKKDDTFETGEKDPKSILCSDDACPCTDRKQLLIGRTAYLYISQEVVDFRNDCRTLLERNIKIHQMVQKLGNQLTLLGGGVANPFYLCETGARRRGLDLAVAMADAKMVAETGFALLRPTPKAARTGLVPGAPGSRPSFGR